MADKPTLTKDDYGIISTALETEIKSAQRAQNTGKTPQIKQVWEQHLHTLRNVQNKVNQL